MKGTKRFRNKYHRKLSLCSSETEGLPFYMKKWYLIPHPWNGLNNSPNGVCVVSFKPVLIHVCPNFICFPFKNLQTKRFKVYQVSHKKEFDNIQRPCCSISVDFLQLCLN